jgi:hypothetical protein
MPIQGPTINQTSKLLIVLVHGTWGGGFFASPNTWRKTSPSRKRSLRARENAEWSGMASSMPSLQNQR